LGKEMRKFLLLIAVLNIFLLGARGVKTFRLTVVNKSDKKIAVKLVEQEYKRAYNLTVESGRKNTPQETDFAVEKGIYTMNVYYDMIYDPVYGYECDQPGSSQLFMFRKMRVTVVECSKTPSNKGDFPLIKYDNWGNIPGGR
jgi:hypothetical protein